MVMLLESAGDTKLLSRIERLEWILERSETLRLLVLCGTCICLRVGVTLMVHGLAGARAGSKT